jgi:hypothetical protein
MALNKLHGDFSTLSQRFFPSNELERISTHRESDAGGLREIGIIMPSFPYS